MKLLLKGIFLSLLFVTLASACDHPAPSSSIMGNNPLRVNDRKTPTQQASTSTVNDAAPLSPTPAQKGWRLFTAHALPIQLSLPSGWRAENLLTVGSSNVSYVRLMGDINDLIFIQQDDTISPHQTADELIHSTDLLKPTLTTLDQLQAVTGYRASPALSLNVDPSQRVWEVYVPVQGQWYKISYDCPSSSLRITCVSIVETIHFIQ